MDIFSCVATAWQLRGYVSLSTFRFFVSNFTTQPCLFIFQVSKNKASSLIKPCSNQCCNQNQCANGAPALSHVKMLKKNSTVHAQQDITADIVKNEKSHHAKSNYKETKETSLESTNFLTKQLRPCARSTAILTLVMDLLGNSSSHSAWQIIKGDFANKDFQEDYPINQNAFALDNFRLSLSRITTTALLSTHMRATCNFDMRGLTTLIT